MTLCFLQEKKNKDDEKKRAAENNNKKLSVLSALSLSLSLRVRRPPVRRGHPRAPFQQLLGAIVLIHNDLDKAQRPDPLFRFLESSIQLALGAATNGKERVRVPTDAVVPVGVVHRFDESDVVPVRDDVVRTWCVLLRGVLEKKERKKKKG